MKFSWHMASNAAPAVALSALMVAGCGTTAPVAKPIVPAGAGSGEPAAVMQPNVPRTGGLKAATEWLRGHATFDPISVPGGDLLFPSGGGLQGPLYVNRKTGQWVQLPLGVSASDFERATAGGGLLFTSGGGHGEDGGVIPFPFQWLLTPRSNGTFAAQNGPLYFPLDASTSVSFGAKPNAVLTSDSTVPNGVQITFGPEPGQSGAFFAGVTSVPPTQVTYNSSRRELILHFSQVRLGRTGRRRATTNADVSRITATETPSGVDVVVSLTKAARFFTGKIVVDPTTQIPQLQIRFTTETPSQPWGP